MTTNPGSPAPAKRAILVITSQVVRGGISGRGLTFALERLGHPVWFLPTILLPWHPGQGPGTRMTADMATFSALVADLIASPKLSEIGGIVTGYLGNPAQAPEIAKLVKAVKAASPDALYVCDPVMGDTLGEEGRLYVPEPTAEAIRDHLVPLADVVTPNCFELGWLTQREIGSELQALAAARSLGVERVLVTSSPAMRRNSISNLLVTPTGALAAEHVTVADPPNGTGDVISGLLLAWLMAGASDETALMRAAASTFELVARSVKKGADELLLAEEQASVAKPMALISSRRVMEARGRA
ncbi:pyridoxal kinase [Roseibium sp. CAU 1637]|uniref:pyridoxal kinase n=1 Tax=Roseibium limicola TaxID=2816037 RepID=A0A939ET44_9HYPH|nr:pyridoxal kinase [Roseibium limicola]MBO0346639.1 pyridoxal kinase [Roseibium limicola]